jgi:hypothetical protein
VTGVRCDPKGLHGLPRLLVHGDEAEGQPGFESAGGGGGEGLGVLDAVATVGLGDVTIEIDRTDQFVLQSCKSLFSWQENGHKRTQRTQ